MGWEASFNQLVERAVAALQPDEVLQLQLVAEESQFTRFNRGRVRQSGQVRDGSLRLTLMAAGRTCDRTFPYAGHPDDDWPLLAEALADARQLLPLLPPDPYLVVPAGIATSREQFSGQLLAPTQVAEAVLEPLRDLDFAGLYAGGRCIRAYGDSVGARHWFATETFTLDYSLFTADGKAVKGGLAGSHWQPETYAQQLHTAQDFLTRLRQGAKTLPRGRYRTYFAPAAVSDLLAMFSWGAISEAALRRSGSALGPLQRGEASFSGQFHLRENFRRGAVPRFNRWGEVAPAELPLIHKGQLVNTLISSRTAKEYGLTSNYAEAGEYLRSPEVAPGSLPEAAVLSELGTGLYVSNLHYLNWSDRPQGRVTGMTRYACFWVEGGEIVAPIENLRFDESLYRCLGSQLIGFTDRVVCIPETDTYGHRQLGATWVPGMLVEDFTFTL